MSWSGSGLGSLHGITGVIAGITGPSEDASQISAVKTLLLSEVAGICTALYTGARLEASGSAAVGLRSVSITLVPLALSL